MPHLNTKSCMIQIVSYLATKRVSFKKELTSYSLIIMHLKLEHTHLPLESLCPCFSTIFCSLSYVPLACLPLSS